MKYAGDRGHRSAAIRCVLATQSLFRQALLGNLGLVVLHGVEQPGPPPGALIPIRPGEQSRDRCLDRSTFFGRRLRNDLELHGPPSLDERTRCGGRRRPARRRRGPSRPGSSSRATRGLAAAARGTAHPSLAPAGTRGGQPHSGRRSMRTRASIRAECSRACASVETRAWRAQSRAPVSAQDASSAAR
jgi:hypothetical protein